MVGVDMALTVKHQSLPIMQALLYKMFFLLSVIYFTCFYVTFDIVRGAFNALSGRNTRIRNKLSDESIRRRGGRESQ